MQDTGERDYHLDGSSSCVGHAVPAFVLYVWVVWLAFTLPVQTPERQQFSSGNF